jgi:uncharacterized protein YPO0396
VRNAGDNSGGEHEKLMALCLAGALSFNLSSPESTDNTPVFAQLMLDEAFSNSDPQFAQQARSTCRGHYLTTRPCGCPRGCEA